MLVLISAILSGDNTSIDTNDKVRNRGGGGRKQLNTEKKYLNDSETLTIYLYIYIYFFF